MPRLSLNAPYLNASSNPEGDQGAYADGPEASIDKAKYLYIPNDTSRHTHHSQS